MQKCIRGLKMKKFLTSFAIILLTCVCVFTGCKAKGLSDNPDTNANVYGNGNIAVVKGDYLYYTNGYVDDYTSVYTNKKQNDWGKVSYGALYRTKLVNGEIDKDSDGFLTKTEVVVPRLVGFENGKFVIIGDYIYYSTPRMREDADGKVRNDYIEFNKVKIDGTKNKAFYTVSSQISVDNWNVYEYNGKAYLLLVTDNQIKSIDIKSQKTTVLGENVGSWVLPEQNQLDDKYIYFTRSIVESDNLSDSGNVIVKADITNGESEAFILKQNATKTIVGHANNMIYYSLAVSNDNTDLYCSDTSLALNENNMSRLTTGGYSSYYIIEDATLTVVAIDSSKNVDLWVNNNHQRRILSDGSEITILAVVGTDIYYIDSDSKIWKKNYASDASAVSLMSEDKTYLIDSLKVDITKNKIYLFAQYTAKDESTNYYLNYINLNTLGDGKFVGKFEDSHLPEKPESTTDEITGETVTAPWID